MQVSVSHTISLQRKNGNISAELDGQEVWNFADSENDAITSAENNLYFLIDDFRTSSENSAGTLDEIRLFTAIPEPNAACLALLSLVGLCFRRNRK